MARVAEGREWFESRCGGKTGMVAGVCSDQQLSGTCSARKQEENARSTVAVPIGDRHQSYPVQLNQSIKHESETTNCFDNSLVRYAGGTLPPLCPVGEKFDFEIPYLMSTFGWKYLG